MKQQILKVIEDLPDDTGVGDALDRLYLLYKVERGLGQTDRGELLSHEDAREPKAHGQESTDRGYPLKMTATMRLPNRKLKPAAHKVRRASLAG